MQTLLVKVRIVMIMILFCCLYSGCYHFLLQWLATLSLPDWLVMKLLHDASIKSAVFRAASRAALREEDKRIINHNDHQSNDLQSVIEEEINKSMSRTSCKEDFVAFTMYN